MQLDIKQRVLLAIYIEYQKDLPEMSSILNNNNTIGVDHRYVTAALEKLHNEGLTSLVSIHKNAYLQNPIFKINSNTIITAKGLDYIEDKFGIEKTIEGLEKVRQLHKKLEATEYENLKELAIKIIFLRGE